MKPAKKVRPSRTGHAWWIESEDGRVWLVRRPGKGLLGGMRALPTSDWSVTPPNAQPPIDADWETLPDPVDHVFTHFALALTVSRTRVESRCMDGLDGEWWPIEDLARAGLPTLFAKAADAAMSKAKT